jgi:hypothetical protein
MCVGAQQQNLNIVCDQFFIDIVTNYSGKVVLVFVQHADNVTMGNVHGQSVLQLQK